MSIRLLKKALPAGYGSDMILPQGFYARETTSVAVDLLGKRLVRRLPSGRRIAGRIVEVEAYLGVEDPAAHTFGGRRTARNESMYGEPGYSYVYFIYGIHFCLNVVTESAGVPTAVLIRALEGVEGGPKTPQHKWMNGPGKLCAALSIRRELNAVRLFDPTRGLFIEDDFSVSEGEIVVGRRVGVDYAGDAAYWPLRFGLRDSPCLSPTKFD